MSTNLDSNQIMQAIYDESSGRIKVDSELTATIITPPGLEVNISQIDDSIVIYGNDGGTNRALLTDNTGQPKIIITSSTLPSGASTSAKQDILDTDLLAFKTANHTDLLVIEGKQDIGNTSLSSIDTKLTSIPFKTRSDTFTTVSSGTTIDTSISPLKYYSLSVVQTGTVTVWDIRLEGSLDNTNFTQILQHTNVTGSGVTLFSSASNPSLYIRSRCAAITLGGGTNLITTILGIQ